ncbi:hypothetical protein [Fusobacterium varium]|uniref:hypothetical protein n=1 Tax=Fusobacterium varium TaxID=856 RepID=UPI003569E6ED
MKSDIEKRKENMEILMIIIKTSGIIVVSELFLSNFLIRNNDWFFFFFLFLSVLFLKKYLEYSYLNEKNYFNNTFIMAILLMGYFTKKYGKEMFILDGIILVIILFFLFFIMKKSFINEETEEELTLFSKRDNDKKKIENFLKNKFKKTLLIIGEWGSGKTYLLNYIFQNTKNYFPIWIKASIYTSKEEMRNFIANEINNIIMKNNIGTSAFSKLLNNFKGLSNLNFFMEDYGKLERKFLSFLDKEIIIIIDDLDRIDLKDIKKYVSLISEFEEYFKIKIIYLMDTKGLIEEEEYFNKYFQEILILNKVDLYDIIDEEEIKKTLNEIKFYISKINYTLEIPSRVVPQERVEEFKELVKGAEKRRKEIIKNFNKKINNLRFIERLMIEIKEKKIDVFLKENLNEKRTIIGTFLFFYLLKDGYKNELSKLYFNEIKYYFLTQQNEYEKEQDITIIMKLFERETIISYYLLDLYINEKEFMTEEKEAKNEIEKIKLKYKKDSITAEEYNVQKLNSDMDRILVTSLLTNKEKEKFFLGFGVKLRSLYNNKVIGIKGLFYFIYHRQLIYYLKEPIIEIENSYFLEDDFDLNSFNEIFCKIDFELFSSIAEIYKFFLGEIFPKIDLLNEEEIFKFSKIYLENKGIKIENEDFLPQKVIDYTKSNFEEKNNSINSQIKVDVEKELSRIEKHCELIKSVYDFIKNNHKFANDTKNILENEYLYETIMIRRNLTDMELREIIENIEVVREKIGNDIKFLCLRQKIEELRSKGPNIQAEG